MYLSWLYVFVCGAFCFYVCVCNYTACCHIAQWTLESPSSWRSCWPGNSWSTQLKKRLPSRPYACGSRNASSASGRLVSQRKTHKRTLLSPYYSTQTLTDHLCLGTFTEAAAVMQHHPQLEREPAAGAEPLPQPP